MYMQQDDFCSLLIFINNKKPSGLRRYQHFSYIKTCLSAFKIKEKEALGNK